MGEAPTRVDDEIPNATLFQVETAPRWVRSILSFLSTGWVYEDSPFPKTMAII